MPSEKKILLSTVYRRHRKDIYDYFGANSARSFFRFEFPRFSNFGLRFIKQNIPEIEILEYPTWEEYKNKVNEEEWDVIGFSFFLNEIHEILEMVNFARKRDIPEIWAGNYGALTKKIHKHFDRIFIGYSENEIAKEFGRKISDNQIIHPPIILYTSFHGMKIMNHGALYTNRGCNHHCYFCQTPQFCKKPSKIPLESIENVLRYYKNLGISEILILDESFGLYKKHAQKVVNLLNNYGFYWIPLARPDIIGANLMEWSKKGMIGVMTSIESFNQKTLDDMSKKEKIDDTLTLIKKLRKMNKFIDAAYMLGFENDTVSSLKKDLKRVAELNLDIIQLCIVTPLPRTPQWTDIEKKYGIFDRDWHHYDAKHLVWNHPHISPTEMRKILKWGFRKVYPRRRVIETSLGFFNRYIDYRGVIGGLNYLSKHFIHSNIFNYNPQEIYSIPEESIKKRLN